MKEYGKMKELSFESDYIEGAHEKILKRLHTMLESYEGVVAAKRYGEEKV